MAGSTVMVIHAPKEEKVTTVVEMASKMKDTGRLQERGLQKTLGGESCVDHLIELCPSPCCPLEEKVNNRQEVGQYPLAFWIDVNIYHFLFIVWSTSLKTHIFIITTFYVRI